MFDQYNTASFDSLLNGYVGAKLISKIIRKLTGVFSELTSVYEVSDSIIVDVNLSISKYRSFTEINMTVDEYIDRLHYKLVGSGLLPFHQPTVYYSTDTIYYIDCETQLGFNIVYYEIKDLEVNNKFKLFMDAFGSKTESQISNPFKICS